MNIKKTIQDSLIILCISIALLVAAELILRVTFPAEIAPASNAPTPEMLAYQFNPDYLISLKPNINKIFTRLKKNGGNIIHWQTNADAFRGPPIQENPKTRIMVYGDSNIQARFSTDANTFVRQLETILNHQGFPNTEVINAGVVGFGPDQSLIKFSQEADIYKPDLVIFHIFADNDYGDIIRNRLFELNQSGGLITTAFPKTLDAKLKRQPKLGISTRIHGFISTLLFVKAARKIIRLITADTSNEYFNYMQRAVIKEYAVYKASQPRKFSHFRDHYDIDLALHPEQESSIEKVKLMRAVLGKAKDLADSKDIAFMVVIEPSVIDLTKKNSGLSYQYLQRFPLYRRNRLTAIIRKICLDKKIHYVDLFNPFMQNQPDKLYFIADDHWDDAGQALAAKETASYIISNSILTRNSSDLSRPPNMMNP